MPDKPRPPDYDFFDPDYHAKRAAYVQAAADWQEQKPPGGIGEYLSIDVLDELSRRKALREFADGRNVLLALIAVYFVLVVLIGWRTAAFGANSNMRVYIWLVLAAPATWIAWSRDGERRTERRKSVVSLIIAIAATIGAGVILHYMTGNVFSEGAD